MWRLQRNVNNQQCNGYQWSDRKISHPIVEHVSIFGDTKKCFDKLWLKDSLLQLKRGGLPHYDLSVLFMLNKEATLQVRTPHKEICDILITEAVKKRDNFRPYVVWS